MSSFSSFDFALLVDGSSATNAVNLSRQTDDWKRICHQFKFEVMSNEIYFLCANEWIICSILLPKKGLLRARPFYHSVVTANCAIVHFTSERENSSVPSSKAMTVISPYIINNIIYIIGK